MTAQPVYTPYLVIFRGIWQSVSPRCGSRWGAAAPGSFWVWDCTLSWVYWTLLLSWKAARIKTLLFLLFSCTGRRAGGSIPVLHLAGELLQDFGGSAVVLQLSLDQCCQLAHLLDLQHTHRRARQLPHMHAGPDPLSLATNRLSLFCRCGFNQEGALAKYV